MKNVSLSSFDFVVPLRFVRRAIHFMYRIVFRFLTRLYIWFIVIPYLAYKEKLGKPFTIRYAFNSIVILGRNRVFKVALNTKNTIEQEYLNFNNICKLYPVLIGIVPDYKMKRNAFISYLSAERYEEIYLPCSIDAAVQIFDIMRECHRAGRRLQINESSELVAGLELISQVYGKAVSQRVRQVVDVFLKNGKYRIGFSHGDFHSRNIVIDEHRNPIMIDLDCVRACSVQELDVIYYLTEREWSNTEILWYETIVRYFKDGIYAEEHAVLSRFGVDYCHGLGVTYLVDRIGQESMNYGIKISSAQLASAVKEILSIPHSIVSTTSQAR